VLLKEMMMAFQVSCPYCSKVLSFEDAFAGQVRVCPECGKQIQLPTAEQFEHVRRQGGFSPESGRLQKMAAHIRRIGIFDIIVAGLLFFWLALAFLAFFLRGSPAFQEHMPPSLRNLQMGTFAWIQVGISCLTCLMQLTAGVLLLRMSRSARAFGIAAGILSCIIIWDCCIYPFSLAVGIYTLSILLKHQARLMFEGGPQALWP
jgi:hypothetical protein